MLDFTFKITGILAFCVVIAFGVDRAWQRHLDNKAQLIFDAQNRCKQIGEDSERIRTGKSPIYLSTPSEVVAEWDKCLGR